MGIDRSGRQEDPLNDAAARSARWSRLRPSAAVKSSSTSSKQPPK
jgi:hypothetical protein